MHRSWPLPPHDLNLGAQDSRQRSYVSGKRWIDCSLSYSLGPDFVHPNIFWPTPLDDLTLKHIKGDHVITFCTQFGAWFARNQFLAQGRGLTKKLEPSSKLTHFKTLKMLLSKKIRGHPYLTSTQDKWWTDIVTRFSSKNTSASIQDPAVFEERQLEPLYRDITSKILDLGEINMANAPDGLIRSKYRGQFSLSGLSNISCDITICTS